jgi:hypothetical protein
VHLGAVQALRVRLALCVHSVPPKPPISHKREFKYLSHTSASNHPMRELLAISLPMCFVKRKFVAILIVQTVKLIHITVFVDYNSISTAQNLADYAILAFQAKLVLTGGIDMYESGSCHHVICMCKENSNVPHLRGHFFGLKCLSKLGIVSHANVQCANEFSVCF